MAKSTDFGRALSSWDDLNGMLNEFNLDELYELLKLEGGAMRRPTYIRRIIQKVISLESTLIRRHLEAKYL